MFQRLKLYAVISQFPSIFLKWPIVFTIDQYAWLNVLPRAHWTRLPNTSHVPAQLLSLISCCSDYCVASLVCQLNGKGNRGRKFLEQKKLNMPQLKFDITNFVAAESLPFTMYPKICQLKSHHGVKIGTSYVRKWSILLKARKLVNARFFSLLLDSSNWYREYW